MDLTNTDHIKCPNCDGDQFEKHTTGPMRISTKGGIWIFPSKEHFACVNCNYVIADPSDLSMGDPVIVYVLGNSLSKQRQGLTKIFVDTETDVNIMQRKEMESMISGRGFFKNDDNSWVFTDEAWKKAQADPEFNLGEGQHAVEVRIMF